MNDNPYPNASDTMHYELHTAWDEGYAEGFAAGRAAATPDPAETDTRGGGDASSVPDQSPAASPDERLREALRGCSATLLTLAPILEAHTYEPNASGHVWNAWTRWGERTLDRIEAALAAADREAPDECRAPHCWYEYGTPCGTCPVAPPVSRFGGGES